MDSLCLLVYVFLRHFGQNLDKIYVILNTICPWDLSLSASSASAACDFLEPWLPGLPSTATWLAHRHSATWHSATCHSATWRSAIQTFGHTDIRPHRHLATQSLGHMDTWPHGHSTTWTLGHMDTRPHALWKQTLGHMDTWPHGHSATLSGFSKRKLEPRFKQKNWIFCLESNLEVSI